MIQPWVLFSLFHPTWCPRPDPSVTVSSEPGRARACSAPYRAPGEGLVKEPHADEIDSASSSAATPTPKILIPDYEIASLSTMERNHFRCGVRPKHEKLYDSMDIQGCGDKIATQMGDSPDDHEDPLTSLSDAFKDTGRQQPASYIESQRNYGSTAHMNDKNHEDAMLGASNNNQLPISFFQSSAGRLRDVTAPRLAPVPLAAPTS